ncbi:MAG TPA: cob(I)yrinic acid a,c-diamide adenosyltransferase [Anaerohalosphaeraceae bacterium]|nr:cob(I)yrinic acid a,c-diamide adenosyltransferase [Anaerohalosphaeraceae bacterium]HOL89698.1 cob(I)yrinic acid a,c-diamide adenosyltransferase [Anaerohalosphaeraceae bacterium]HPP55991.1 cob(I)yrinic acid a,c-diamide adenosyltransferase [Anaerohalosphaeraceae bacterium]
MLEKGLVQIYTGDGKGKTTAALGLALRTAGHGGRVLIYQFLKPSSLNLGERTGLQNIGNITLLSLDEPWDMFESMGDQKAIERIRTAVGKALKKIQTAAHERYYDLIVLDEIVFCLSKGLASMDDIRQLLANRDPCVELVLTGRGATQELMDMADLVTEMKSVKHPFEKGISARRGIEY